MINIFNFFLSAHPCGSNAVVSNGQICNIEIGILIYYCQAGYVLSADGKYCEKGKWKVYTVGEGWNSLEQFRVFYVKKV